MKLYAVASAIALTSVAGSVPALAQDDKPYFEGPYVSGSVGMAAQKNDAGETLVFDTNRDGTYGDTVRTASGANGFGPGFCHGVSGGATPAAGCSGDENHGEYAIRIGYDGRVNNLVGGVLFEASKSKSRDRVTGFDSAPARITLAREVDYALMLRGRVGWVPGDGRGLFYITGGPGFARMKHSFTTTDTSNGFTQFNNSKMIFGGQIGGGAEVMLTKQVGLGLEYLYNRFHDKKYYLAVTHGTAPTNDPFILASAGTNIRPSNTNYSYHSLRATLSFHF